MRELQRILEKRDRLAVGLMSGTSADGIDAALVHIRGCGPSTTVETRAFTTVPFDDDMRSRVLEAGSAGVPALSALDYALGEALARAVLGVIARAGLEPGNVDFVASHGQTVYHDPEGTAGTRSTLQIGEPAIIAERTGLPVVYDFRARDVAAGGSGAPLVPLVDHMLFSDPVKTRLLVNLGGIANITILPAGGALDDLIAFDVGPCNVLVDGLAEVLIGKPYDDGGAVAASGRPSNKLVEEVLKHPYYASRPPKSTGRETFGERFTASVLSSARRLGLTERDTLASVAVLVGRSIQRALAALVPLRVRAVDEIVLSGGGIKNRGILLGFEAAFPETPIATTREYGVDPDAKEAVAFAILGNETLEGRAGNVPGATGARRAVVLGAVVPSGRTDRT
jgi:anhydro-N-acetylmuramic acid kinase